MKPVSKILTYQINANNFQQLKKHIKFIIRPLINHRTPVFYHISGMDITLQRLSSSRRTKKMEKRPCNFNSCCYSRLVMLAIPMHSVSSRSGTFFDTNIFWRRKCCRTIRAFGPRSISPLHCPLYIRDWVSWSNDVATYHS